MPGAFLILMIAGNLHSIEFAMNREPKISLVSFVSDLN